jgi:hypothetical protein
MQVPDYNNNFEVTGCEFDIDWYFQCYQINFVTEILINASVLTLAYAGN